MLLGVTIKEKLQKWPLDLFTLDNLQGYVLVAQYIFITQWTLMDFPSEELVSSLRDVHIVFGNYDS